MRSAFRKVRYMARPRTSYPSKILPRESGSGFALGGPGPNTVGRIVRICRCWAPSTITQISTQGHPIDLSKSPIAASLLNCVPGALVDCVHCCDASTDPAAAAAAAASSTAPAGCPQVAPWMTPTSRAIFRPQTCVSLSLTYSQLEIYYAAFLGVQDSNAPIAVTNIL